MPEAREIPALTSELVELSKEYLRQETIEPAKRLGKLVGFSLLAGLLFGIGGVLLSIAGLRVINDALPESDLWTSLGFVVTALLALVVAGAVVYTASNYDPAGESRHD